MSKQEVTASFPHKTVMSGARRPTNSPSDDSAASLDFLKWNYTHLSIPELLAKTPSLAGQLPIAGRFHWLSKENITPAPKFSIT